MASEKIITELGDPGYKMPFSKRRRVAYKKVFPNLAPKIESVVADAAYDEQLALNMMSCGEEFTGIKVQSKDLAHAMRRVGKRSSFADSYLNQVTLALNMRFDCLGM